MYITCGVGASNTTDGSNDVMHDVTSALENSAHVWFNETYCAAEQPEAQRNKKYRIRMKNNFTFRANSPWRKFRKYVEILPHQIILQVRMSTDLNLYLFFGKKQRISLWNLLSYCWIWHQYCIHQNGNT